MNNEAISTVAAAKELSITSQGVRLMIKTGRFPKGGCFQIGGRGQWKIYRWALEQAKRFAA